MKQSHRSTIPGLLFIFTSVILLTSSYPSIGWWDSGEYASHVYHLSIPLSGGSILYILLGKIFTIVFSFLPTIKAITLLSIASTSLASVLFYYTLLEILDHFPMKTGDSVKRSVAFLTAMSLPFLYSIWIESHVARIYSLGLLLTGIILLCTVKIWFTEDENLKVRLFLLNVFLLGIDFAAHRLNTPFVVVMFVLLLFPLRKHALTVKFWLLVIMITAVSISVHLYLLVRSGTTPPMRMEDVQTWGQLLSWIRMDRLGKSNFLILLERRAPFWDYQLYTMYLRYLGWNFLGSNAREISSLFPHLRPVPFVLSCTGFIFCMLKRLKTFVLVFLAFSAFSIILVFYLNVTEGFHQIREIDRLYLPSFVIFHLWVGIGLYGLFLMLLKLSEKLSLRRKTALIPILCLGFLILPLNIILSNWKGCNRSGYYFPIDFAYNVLSSCERDGVVFTNGDNDTFPLWYLQEVEGFRPDISVVNVNLLNTRFYIKQLTEGENIFPVDSTLIELSELAPIKIEDPVDIKIAPPDFSVNAYSTSDTVKLTFPGLRFGDYNLLRVQDIVMISFFKENRWKRPVYFVSTVAPVNLLGSEDYLSTVGIARKLLPVKNVEILPEELENNLFHVYRFRSFNDPGVYLDNSTISLYNNFRTAFIVLANHCLENGNREKAVHVFHTMKEKLPDWRFTENQNRLVDSFEIRLQNMNK